MEFGITFKGFVDHDRARYLIQAAEYAGFTYCWFYDSHILWRDPYPLRCSVPSPNRAVAVSILPWAVGIPRAG